MSEIRNVPERLSKSLKVPKLPKMPSILGVSKNKKFFSTEPFEDRLLGLLETNYFPLMIFYICAFPSFLTQGCVLFYFLDLRKSSGIFGTFGTFKNIGIYISYLALFTSNSFLAFLTLFWHFTAPFARMSCLIGTAPCGFCNRDGPFSARGGAIFLCVSDAPERLSGLSEFGNFPPVTKPGCQFYFDKRLYLIVHF